MRPTIFHFLEIKSTRPFMQVAETLSTDDPKALCFFDLPEKSDFNRFY